MRWRTLATATSRQGPALTRRLALIALTALLALVAVDVASARDAAKGKQRDTAPCWKILTNDAFDGKVDGIYPPAIYSEAIRHLPTDVQSYSTIADVINRARQDALQKQGKGVKADPTRCGYPLAKTGTSTGKTSTTGGTTTGRTSTTGGTTTGGTSTTGGTTTGGDGGGDKGPIPGVIDSVGSDKADSFPVALIVIAAVAGVLLLGGGAGFAVRRKQRRQAELEAAAGSPPDDSDEPGPPELNP